MYGAHTLPPASTAYNATGLPELKPHLVQPILLAKIDQPFLLSHLSVFPSCFQWFEATLAQSMKSIESRTSFERGQPNPAIRAEYLTEYLRLIRK